LRKSPVKFGTAKEYLIFDIMLKNLVCRMWLSKNLGQCMENFVQLCNA